MVADEVHTSDRHRMNFRFAKKWGTFGNYKSSKLDRVIDTIHFAPSHHSRLLQAADLVCYMRHRRQTVTESDPRAKKANDGIWAEIEPVIHVNQIWTP